MKTSLCTYKYRLRELKYEKAICYFRTLITDSKCQRIVARTSLIRKKITTEEEEEENKIICQKSWLPDRASAHQRWLPYTQ